MSYAITAALKPWEGVPRYSGEGKPSLQYLARKKRRAVALGLQEDDSPEAKKKAADEAAAQQEAILTRRDAREEQQRLAAEERAEKRSIAAEDRQRQFQKELLETKYAQKEAEDRAKEAEYRDALGLPTLGAPSLGQRVAEQAAAPSGQVSKGTVTVGPAEPEAPKPSLNETKPAIGELTSPATIVDQLDPDLLRAVQKKGGLTAAQALNEQQERNKAREKTAKEATEQQENEVALAETIRARNPKITPEDMEKQVQSAKKRKMTPIQLATEIDDDARAEAEPAKAARKKAEAISIDVAVEAALADLSRDPEIMANQRARYTAIRDNPKATILGRQQAAKIIDAIDAKVGKRKRTEARGTSTGRTRASREADRRASRDLTEELED